MMKKSVSIYSAIWAFLLILFNVLVFAIPSDKSGVAFWLGYAFITIAFVGQWLCTFVAFRSDSLQKTFYNLPLISVSYGSMLFMLIGGVACMAIPVLPNWLGAVVCFVILVLMIVAVFKVGKATLAAETVSAIDHKIKTQTFFVKDLTVDAQVLMSAAKTADLSALTKKIYEAIRYSDPMSVPALQDTETQIRREFNAFADAIRAGDVEMAKNNVDILLTLIESRNLKCKMLK